MTSSPSKTDQNSRTDENKQQPQTGELDAEQLDQVAGGGNLGGGFRTRRLRRRSASR